jgi:uncharacterized protein YcbX
MNAAPMLIGRLEGVRRYPIKSLRGEILDSTSVAIDGIPGDRGTALFALGDHARAGKPYRGKEHDGLHLLDDVPEARAAAAARGVGVEEREGRHFFDDASVSLIVDRWLDELSEHLGYRVEWERFRPNFFVRAAEDFAQNERELTDAQLRLGSVGLRVRSPIERCVAVTYHPQGAPSDPRILRFLAQQRDALLGIYCDVVEPGTARLGDALALVEA